MNGTDRLNLQRLRRCGKATTGKTEGGQHGFCLRVKRSPIKGPGQAADVVDVHPGDVAPYILKSDPKAGRSRWYIGGPEHLRGANMHLGGGQVSGAFQRLSEVACRLLGVSDVAFGVAEEAGIERCPAGLGKAEILRCQTAGLRGRLAFAVLGD